MPNELKKSMDKEWKETKRMMPEQIDNINKEI